MSKYLITGATGLIGQSIIKELLKDDSNLILCPVRNINNALRIFGYSKSVILIQTDLETFLKDFEEQVEYIVHCASPTASKYFVEFPVETLLFGIETTSAILKYACKRNVKKILYLSSLEIYGTIEDDLNPITESTQGYVDPLNVRSSYNMVKRTCESLCYAYYKEYNVPVCIARLTQTVSPDINDNDNRIFAQFCRKVAKYENIELYTSGESARQYIYIDDAISALLKILQAGESGEAYNIANESTYISAKALALYLQKNFNPSGSVVVNLKDGLGYAPTTKLKLDTTKLKNLGWVANVDLYEMSKVLINSLREKINPQILNSNE